jgi:hypothetical protein
MVPSWLGEPPLPTVSCEVGCSILAGHQIGDAGAVALARVLTLSGLKTIDLEGAAYSLAMPCP